MKIVCEIADMQLRRTIPLKSSGLEVICCCGAPISLKICEYAAANVLHSNCRVATADMKINLRMTLPTSAPYARIW